jgi:hypothetical protein
MRGQFMEGSSQEFEPLGPPVSRWPPDPLGSSDVLQIIRLVQDGTLAQLEECLVKEKEEEETQLREEAWHQARCHALRQHVAVFRQLMEEGGNPGLEYFGGSKTQAQGLTFLERLQNPPKYIRRAHFWPLATYRRWISWRTSIVGGDINMLLLTSDGEWWRGAAHDTDGQRSYYLIEQVRLAEMDAPAGFSSIGGAIEAASVDRAVVGTIAELMDEHGLMWPSG